MHLPTWVKRLLWNSNAGHPRRAPRNRLNSPLDLYVMRLEERRVLSASPLLAPLAVEPGTSDSGANSATQDAGTIEDGGSAIIAEGEPTTTADITFDTPATDTAQPPLASAAPHPAIDAAVIGGDALNADTLADALDPSLTMDLATSPIDGPDSSLLDDLDSALVNVDADELDSTASEIVFIDSRVNDYETLIEGVSSDAEVVILRANEDGVEQIEQHLEGREEIAAIHIVSHGSSGRLHLGSSTLTNENLDSYAAELTGIGNSLTEDGDILFYGCNVAEGNRGAEFLENLAAATDADVAASTDDTGAADQGGDWRLEAEVGSLETQVAISSSTQASYAHVLSEPTEVYVDDDFSNPTLGEDPDGDGPATNFGYDSFATIQEGIDAVSSGGTVTVHAGSYSEDLLIAKGVTIEGVGTAELNSQHTITASDVTLSNMTFNVANNEVGVSIDASGGPLDNILIEDSIFNLDSPTVAIDVGVGAGNSKISNVTIEDNVFNGPADMISNPMRIGSGFGSQHDVEIEGLTFQRNVVDGGSIPVYLRNEDIKDVLVTQNTFTNTDGTFYVWANPGEATSSSGQLLNFEYSENSVDSSNTYGIGFDVFGDGLDDDNFDASAPPRVTGNSFDVAGAYGIGAVSILSTGISGTTIDASGNWYGVNTPTEVAAEVSSNVDYTPWLDAETDIDGGTPGFQGDLSTLNVDDDSPQTGPTGRVQEALDLVTASKVILHDGTYMEDITITLDGTELTSENGAASTILQGVALVPSASFPLAVPNIDVIANDVEIHDLTLRGPDPTAGFYSSGMLIGGNNVNIHDNAFEVTNAASLADVSQGIQTYRDGNNPVPGADLTGLNIHDNTFTAHGAGTAGYEAIFINHTSGDPTPAGTATVADNVISGPVIRGVTTERSLVTITGNTIETSLDPIDGTLDPGEALQGIHVGDFSGRDTNNVMVSQNTIGGSSGFTQGVRVGSAGQSVSGISITENFINDAGVGVLVRASAGGVTVFNNDLSGNTTAVENADTGATLDASGNWWGSNVEATVAAAISGIADVDFTPFLDNGDDDDLVTAGFQGDFSTLHVTTMGQQVGGAGRVQEALDLVTASKVILHDGTFVEDIEITQANTELTSENGKLSTTLQGVATNPQASFPLATPNINVLASGVSIHDLTIATPVVAAGFYSSGIVIDSPDVEIFDNVFTSSQGDTAPTGVNDSLTNVLIQTWAGSNSGKSSNVDGLHIHDNTFDGDGKGYYGIFVNPQGEPVGTTMAEEVRIEGNTFTGNIWRAIEVERSNAVIDLNVITPGAETLHVWGGSGISVRDFFGAAIENVTISNNFILGNDGTAGQGFANGILLGFGSQSLTVITVDDNDITDNETGVRIVSGGSGVTFTSNDFAANTEYHLRDESEGLGGATVYGIFNGTVGTNTFDAATVVTDGAGEVQSTSSLNIRPGIQQSIDDASPGQTVEVGPGTYDEQLTIDKSLTLMGAADASDGTTPDPGTHSILQPTATPAAGVPDVAINAGSVTIKEMVFDFNGSSDTRGGLGIFVSDLNGPNTKGVTIEDNAIYTGDGAGVGGTGIQTGKNADVSNLLVHSNYFFGDATGFGEGVYVNPGTGSSIAITDNTFRGLLFSAVSIEASNVTASGNDIDSEVSQGVYGIRVIDFTGTQSFSNISVGDTSASANTIQNVQYGVRVGTSTDVGSTLSVDVENNEISNTDTGLWLRHGADVTIKDNAFSTNADYQIRDEEETLGGTDVYEIFRHTSATHTGNTFDTATVVTDGAGVVQSTTSLSIRPGIQQSIDDASADDTVEVAPGTYTENVDVNKAVTLKGEATIDGTLTASVAGAAIAPGLSPGILSTGDFSLDSGVDLAIEFTGTGTTAGVNFDQVGVTGTVNLNADSGAGSNLNVMVADGFFAAVGSTFVIINNDDTDSVEPAPLAETKFAGLPEGSNISPSGRRFQISYEGGDGNDVELTLLAPETVYVNDDWTGTGDGIDPDGLGPANAFGYDAFDNIQDAIDAVTSGGTVIVFGGDYADVVDINKSLNPIQIKNDTQFGGSTVDISGDVRLSVDATFETDDADLTFGKIDGNQALVINGDDIVTFSGLVGDATALTSLTRDAMGTTVLDAATFAAAVFDFDDAVLLENDVTLIGSTSVDFASTVDSAAGETNDLTVNSPSTTFNGAVGTATGGELGALTTDDQGGGDTTTINTSTIETAGSTVTFNDPLTLMTDVTITDSGSTGIFFNNTVDSDGTPRDLTVITTNALAEIEFRDAVGDLSPLNNVTVTNAGLLDVLDPADFFLDGFFLQDGTGLVNLGGDISTTADDITFMTDVTLKADVALVTGAGSGNVAFQSNLDDDGMTSNQSLTVAVGIGNASFMSAVGSSQALAAITINSALDVTFSSTVATAANLTQMAGTGTTTFNGTSGTGIGGLLDVNTNNVAFNSGTTAVVGTVTIDAANSISSNADDAVADVTGTTFNVTAGAGGIGTAGVHLDLTATTQFNADTSAAGSSIFVDSIGALPLGAVTAGVGEVTLVGTAAITDANAGSTNITAAATRLEAADGIGSSDALETAVSTLAANNTTLDNIEINNSVGGLLTIGTVDGLSGVTNTAPAGTVEISNASPMTIDDDVTSVDAITLTAIDDNSDGPGDEDDLIVSNTDTLGTGTVEIRSTGASVALRAGDDLTINPTATVQAATTITLNVDFGDADSSGGTANLFGTLQSDDDSEIAVSGDADGDTFVIDSNGGTLGDGGTLDNVKDNIQFDGGGGADTLSLDDFGDSTADTSVSITRTAAGSGQITGLIDAGSAVSFMSFDAGSQVNLQTGDNATDGDTVTVNPNENITFNLDGNDPTTGIGDTMNFVTPLGETATITQTGANSGSIQSSGGFGVVNYQEFESLEVSGDIVVDGTGDDDTLELTATSRDDGSYVLTTNGVAGPTVNLTNITSFVFNGMAGDDQFILNHPAMDVFAPSGGISFDGGTSANDMANNPPGDSLTINGPGVTLDKVVHRFDAASVPAEGDDGVILLEDAALALSTSDPFFAYTGLNPIVDNMSAVDREFNFTAGMETITLSDDTAIAGNSLIDSDLGESVSFKNPTGATRIDATVGSGADTINVEGVDAAYDADLIIEGDSVSGEEDTVNFQTNPTDIGATSRNLTVLAHTVNVKEAVAASGAVDIDANDDVSFEAGGSITATGAGSVLITADADGSGLGSGGALFMADGATIDAGSGAIDLDADEDITLGGVTTTTSVTIDSASGSIVDGGDTNTDISAATAVLNAAGAVGSLDTAIANVEGSAGSGGFALSNSGDLTVGLISGVDGISTSNGAISLTAASSITVAETVDSNGAAIEFDATTDVNINAAVLSDGGTVTARADNDVTFSAAGSIDVESGAPTVSVIADDDSSSAGGITMADGSSVDAVGGTIDFDAFDDIALAILVTTGEAQITTTGGAISDNTALDSTANITASGAALRAATGIGNFVASMAADEANDINVAVTDLAATTVTGDIFISDDAVLNLTTVDGLAGISITTGGANQDILIREGKASDADPLTVVQDVTNSGAGRVTLFADGTAKSDELQVDNGVTASGGNILLVSGGDVDFDGSPTVSTLATGTISVHAGQMLSFSGVLSDGSASDAADILQGGDFTIQSAGGTITLSARDDVELDIVDAAAGMVVVNADSDSSGVGQITDNLPTTTGGNEDPNVTANSAVFRAATGIGSGNALEIAVSTLAALNSTTGNAEVDNDVGGLLTIGTVDGLSGATNSAPGGTIVVTNASPMTVDDDVIADGDITLTATDDNSDGPGEEDDLTVNAGKMVRSDSGDVNLRGGDNVMLVDSSTVEATIGKVTIEGDFGDADTGVGTTITVEGTIASAAQAEILGNADNDVINIDPQGSHTVDAAKLDGGEGDDEYNVQLGNLAGAIAVEDSGSGGADELNVKATTSGETLTIEATQLTLDGSSPLQNVTYTSNLETLNVDSDVGNDTFNVTPSADTEINVMGGTPAAGDAGVPPGDTLNVNTPSGESATITQTDSDAGSIQSTGGFQAVTYDEIETLGLSGGIVVQGKDGSGNDDTLTLTATSRDDGSYVLTTDGVDGPTVNLTDITSFVFNGLDGDDRLIINHPAGDVFAPATGGTTFNGGSSDGDAAFNPPGDSLSINGPTSLELDMVVHQFDATSTMTEGDGEIRVEESGLIALTDPFIFYTGLNPIFDNMSAAAREFNFAAGMEAITLSDDSTPNDGKSLIDSTFGESVTFANPTGSLLIDTTVGSGADTINIEGVDAAYDADLTIIGDSDATEEDTISFQTNATNIGTGNLSATAHMIIASSSVSTSDGGMIGLMAARNIVMNAGSALTSLNGKITLQANTAGTTSGTFTAVALNDADVTSTGGDILIEGRGGDTGSSNRGVDIFSGSRVRSLGSGMVTIVGTGGDADANNDGLRIRDAGTLISSVDGAIQLTGTGGSGTGDANKGLRIEIGAQVVSTGDATISIMGFGGTGGDFQGGVDIRNADTAIESTSGNISIMGTGGTGGMLSEGVAVFTGARIESLGTGVDAATIDIVGVGGTGSEGAHGVRLQGTDVIVRSKDGKITFDGEGGSGDSNEGVALFGGANVISTGAAEILLDGEGGDGGSVNTGVRVSGSGTTVTSETGLITILGTGGMGTGAGSAFNSGVSVSNEAIVSSTGSDPTAANIVIMGSGGTGEDENYGVRVSGANTVVNAADGDIMITGIGGAGTGSFNTGVEIDFDGKVETTGTDGDISIDGTGGALGTGGTGLDIFDGGIVKAADGNIVLEGTADGGGSSIAGVAIYTNSLVEVSGDGTIEIIGDVDPGTNAVGVAVGLSSTVRTTGSGGIQIAGTGGDAGSDNHGVLLELDGDVESTTALATTSIIRLEGTAGGSDGILITGTGSSISSETMDIEIVGDVAAGETGRGVHIADGAVVESSGATADAATILIDGTGQGAADAEGVLIEDMATMITSNAGAVTILGSDSDTTPDSDNVVIDAATVQSVTGDISVTALQTDITMDNAGKILSDESDAFLFAANDVLLGIVALDNDGGMTAAGTAIITADADTTSDARGVGRDGVGQVLDNLDTEDANVTAAAVAFRAGSGIGLGAPGDAGADDINTSGANDSVNGGVLTLAAETVWGDIFIRNDDPSPDTDELEIGTVAATTPNELSGVTITDDTTAPFSASHVENSGGDTITIISASPMEVNQDLNNNDAGNVLLAAQGQLSDDDLTVNANVNSTGTSGANVGGDVTLLAGDTVTLGTAAAVGVTTDGDGDVILAAGLDFNDGTIQSGTTAGNVSMFSGSIAASDEGDVLISAPNNVELSITSANDDGDPELGSVFIEADRDGAGGGSITDALAGEAANIVGDSAALSAATGVGTLADDLNTQLSTLAGENTTATGDFVISNTGTLSIGTATLPPAPFSTGSMISGITTQGGEIQISVASDMNVDAMLDSNGGAITLTATGAIGSTSAGAVRSDGMYDGDGDDAGAILIHSTGTGDVVLVGDVTAIGGAGGTGGGGSGNGGNAGSITIINDDGLIEVANVIADGGNGDDSVGGTTGGDAGNITVTNSAADDDVNLTAHIRSRGGTGTDSNGLDGTVKVESGASIVDMDETQTDIDSGQAELIAVTGIAGAGTADNEILEVDVDGTGGGGGIGTTTLAATTATGNIAIDDVLGSFTIGTVGGTTGVTVTSSMGGLIDLEALAGELVVEEEVSTEGDGTTTLATIRLAGNGLAGEHSVDLATANAIAMAAADNVIVDGNEGEFHMESGSMITTPGDIVIAADTIDISTSPATIEATGTNSRITVGPDSGGGVTLGMNANAVGGFALSDMELNRFHSDELQIGHVAPLPGDPHAAATSGTITFGAYTVGDDTAQLTLALQSTGSVTDKPNESVILNSGGMTPNTPNLVARAGGNIVFNSTGTIHDFNGVAASTEVGGNLTASSVQFTDGAGNGMTVAMVDGQDGLSTGEGVVEVSAAGGSDADIHVHAPIENSGTNHIHVTSSDSVMFNADGDITQNDDGEIRITANANNLSGDDGNVIFMADGAVIDANYENGGSGGGIGGPIILDAAGTDGVTSTAGTGGNITLGHLSTTSTTDAAVIIVTDASVLDGNSDNADVDAQSVLFQAGNGFGTNNDAIETEVSNIAGSGGVGEIFVFNTGNIDIAALTSPVMVNSGTTPAASGLQTQNATIHVSAASSISILQPIVSAGGLIDLDATEDITSTAAGSINSSTAADSASNAGAVQIDAMDLVGLVGMIDARGGDETTDDTTANDGGQVDIMATHETVTVDDIMTSGGNATGSGGGEQGGSAGAINITTLAAANDITLNGTLAAVGGSGASSGTSGIVGLVAGGNVIDGSDSPEDIEAESLAIDAEGVGTGTGIDDVLETKVANLAANIGSGGLHLANTGDLSITTVTPADGSSITGITAADSAINISVASSLGVNAAVMSPNGSVSFTATESINGSGLITAAVGALMAQTGIGATGALMLDVENLMNAESMTGGIQIDLQDSANDGVLVTKVDATDSGDVILTGTAGSGQRTYTLVETGGSMIDISVYSGDINLHRVIAGGAGNVMLTTMASGDVLLTGSVNAADDRVTIKAAGAILDNDDDNDPTPDTDVAASELVAVSEGGVGAAGQRIETNLSGSAGVLEAHGGTGGVYVVNTGDLILDDVNAAIGPVDTAVSATGADIEIEVMSDLTNLQKVSNSSDGNVSFIADGKITVEALVITGNGTSGEGLADGRVFLTAEDEVIVLDVVETDNGKVGESVWDSPNSAMPDQIAIEEQGPSATETIVEPFPFVARISNPRAQTYVSADGLAVIKLELPDLPGDENYQVLINWNDVDESVDVFLLENGGCHEFRHEYLDGNPTGNPADPIIIDVAVSVAKNPAIDAEFETGSIVDLPDDNGIVFTVDGENVFGVTEVALDVPGEGLSSVVIFSEASVEVSAAREEEPVSVNDAGAVAPTDTVVDDTIVNVIEVDSDKDLEEFYYKVWDTIQDRPGDKKIALKLEWLDDQDTLFLFFKSLENDKYEVYYKPVGAAKPLLLYRLHIQDHNIVPWSLEAGGGDAERFQELPEELRNLLERFPEKSSEGRGDRGGLDELEVEESAGETEPQTEPQIAPADAEGGESEPPADAKPDDSDEPQDSEEIGLLPPLDEPFSDSRISRPLIAGASAALAGLATARAKGQWKKRVAEAMEDEGYRLSKAARLCRRIRSQGSGVRF